MEALRSRVIRQEALAELGLLALKGTDIPTLMREAASRVRQVLAVEYCEVLELLPDAAGFLLRSGGGWREGYVGRAVVGINLDSQAGYTLISGAPVRVEDAREEARFGDTPLLEEHGVLSGLTTVLRRQGRVYGVLGAHAARPRAYDEEEAGFLSGVAEVLGAAMDRSLSEEDVRIEAMERTEEAERRFRFLAEANAVLSASSDYAGALSCTARLAVPALADWCFVDVVGGEGGGEIHRLAVAHEGRASEEALAGELSYRYPLDPGAPHGTPKALRTGRPEIIAEVTDGVLRAIARDAGHLAALRELGPRSYVCVPLRVRRRTIGALGLASTGPERVYGEGDLPVVEGLAYCAALTIDHMIHAAPGAGTVEEMVRTVGENRPVIVTAGEETGREAAPGLTPRQLEVLGLIARGMSAKEIKAELGLSEATVRGHIRLVLRALGAHSQLEAVAKAREFGLLSS